MTDTIEPGLAKHVERRECKLHGNFEATITTHLVEGLSYKSFQTTSACPRCTVEAQEMELRKEARERQASIDRIRYDSGVPARFTGCSFADYQASTEPMKLVRDLLCNFATRWDDQSSTGQSLLLVGGPGTGKTMLSCSVINTIAEDLVGSEYSTAAELVSKIKSHYGQRGGDKGIADDIAWLKRVPLLVIDELDVGLSEHDVMLLFRVIDARYAALQPMILISLPQRVVVQHPAHGPSDPERMPPARHQRVLAVAREVRRSAARAHHRRTAGHRFEGGIAPARLLLGGHEQV